MKNFEFKVKKLREDKKKIKDNLKCKEQRKLRKTCKGKRKDSA